MMPSGWPTGQARAWAPWDSPSSSTGLPRRARTADPSPTSDGAATRASHRDSKTPCGSRITVRKQLDPHRGAVAVGARPFLVAFNAYLDTDDVEVARAVARRVRESGGGLPAVRALGFGVGGKAQVSMNLTDLEQTSIPVALEAVRSAAAGLGASVESTELVGLAPLEAVLQTARYYLGLRELDAGTCSRDKLYDPPFS